jgi:hypothetical protein
MEDETAELPMLALILTRKFRPMIIGSSSVWRMLAGMIARPIATSLRTNSGSTFSRIAQNRISSVMMPLRAKCICEALPDASIWARRASTQAARRLGKPARGSWPCGPVVS